MNNFTVLLHLPKEVCDAEGDRVLTFLAWVSATDMNDAIKKARLECADGYAESPDIFPVVAVFQGFLTDVSCNTAI